MFVAVPGSTAISLRLSFRYPGTASAHPKADIDFPQTQITLTAPCCSPDEILSMGMNTREIRTSLDSELNELYSGSEEDVLFF